MRVRRRVLSSPIPVALVLAAATAHGQSAFTVTARWQATAGAHHFVAEVDPGNTLGETFLQRADNVSRAIDASIAGTGIQAPTVAALMADQMVGDGVPKNVAGPI